MARKTFNLLENRKASRTFSFENLMCSFYIDLDLLMC